MELLLVLCKRSNGHIKDIEVRNDDRTEWNVYECGQEDAEIGHDEIHDEDLLRKSCVVGACGFVILKFGKTSCNLSKNSVQNRVDCCKDSSRNEDLASVSIALMLRQLYLRERS